MQIMHNSAGFGEYPRKTLHNPAHYAKPMMEIAFRFKGLQTASDESSDQLVQLRKIHKREPSSV